MGNKHHKTKSRNIEDSSSDDGPPVFTPIKNQYETMEQIQQDLRRHNLESSELVIGIDYTISNTTQGKNSFYGYSLHDVECEVMNPYQHVISVLARTLEPFDDDNLIPVYGFGDANTQGDGVFNLKENGAPCNGLEETLARYIEVTPMIKLAGPTSFAPIIREAIKLCREEKSYHILVIIADGQVTPDNDYNQPTTDTINAIVDASNYPLSIILVGVGDGPWDMMETFDDELPDRRFDNFQFVDYHKEITSSGPNPQIQELDFAIAALMEIPEQYYYIKKLGLI